MCLKTLMHPSATKNTTFKKYTCLAILFSWSPNLYLYKSIKEAYIYVIVCVIDMTCEVRTHTHTHVFILYSEVHSQDVSELQIFTVNSMAFTKKSTLTLYGWHFDTLHPEDNFDIIFNIKIVFNTWIKILKCRSHRFCHILPWDAARLLLQLPSFTGKHAILCRHLVTRSVTEAALNGKILACAAIPLVLQLDPAACVSSHIISKQPLC